MASDWLIGNLGAAKLRDYLISVFKIMLIARVFYLQHR